jgi:hypothetical protein
LVPFFVNPASKLERAVRALVSLQINAGQYVITDAFIANDSRARILPNRTFVARAFTPTKPYRPEGVVTLEIQHHFPSVVQPAAASDLDSQRTLLETYFGQTMDVLNLGGTNDQDMQPLATAITAAGRWLAVPDATPSGIQIAADNADMANFRCDWVKFGQPMITRGKPETQDVNWVEIIHLSAFVSNATN